jgi:tetratricopeptide (TPR) repeat protein
MSAAFMEAEDQETTIFAYYQSYLVVDYLISTYGFEPLQKMLRDLGDGTDINVALAAHFAPMDELDETFADYARDLAQAFAPDLDLSRKSTAAPGLLTQILGGPSVPFGNQNLDVVIAQVTGDIDESEWQRARDTLEPIIAQGVYFSGAENIHRLHALVCRELEDTAAEKASLLTIVEHEAGQLTAVTRLLKLAAADHDWPAIARWSDAWLAIDPLAATPWRARLQAHTELNETTVAITAGRTLLRLDPPDRASIHHQLAMLLEPGDPDAARRHVLQALEDAPRFRAAYELLDRISLTPVHDSL